MCHKSKIKKLVAFFILFSLANFGGEGVFALQTQKTVEIYRNVIQEPTPSNVDAYIKAMLKEYKRANRNNDLENAADYLRSALYFLKQRNKNSVEYTNNLEKLNEVLNKMNAPKDNINRLEIAKNLYLENKLFASAFEFQSLLEDKYQIDVCYEYLGDIANSLNSREEAFHLYEKSLNFNPDNLNSKYKFAKILLDKGRVNEALFYIEEVIEGTNSNNIINDIIVTFTKRTEENPKDENNFGILGLAYQKLGQYEKTYEYLKKSLILNPFDIFLRYYLGNLLFEIKEYSFANEIYSEILEENPYESQIRIARAKSYLKINKKNEAIKDYQIVLAMYPDSLQAQYGLYSALKGTMPLDKIISTFYPIEPNYKLNSEGYINLGYFANKFENTNDALVFFEKALSLNPKSETPYIELYKIYQLLGQKDKAKNILQKAHALFPKNGEIVELYSAANSDKVNEKKSIALSYLNEGEYKKAISMYEQINPKDKEIYEAIGNCYKQLADYKNAITNYNKALEISPNNSDLYYAIGATYFEDNKLALAKQALKKSLEKDPKNIKSSKILNFIEQTEVMENIDIACAFYDKKDYASALRILNRAVEANLNDPKVYYFRGLSKKELNDYKGAIADFKETLKIDKRYTEVYYPLAICLEKTGKKREALVMYEKALGEENLSLDALKYAEQKVIELGEKYY